MGEEMEKREEKNKGCPQTNLKDLLYQEHIIFTCIIFWNFKMLWVLNCFSFCIVVVVCVFLELGMELLY